ncbi:DUF368 domain-containing protein [Saccharopolyspora montiporae]|uniref:DUF368 domain-containing protein n=1 Tax=Saccharopolyspora montiporae TaxID=2781240 RepID=UPI00351C5057
MTKPAPEATAAPSRARYLLDVVRGALMGTAETVPGVSGGTVALIVGVYATLLTSAGHLLSGVRRAVVDLVRRRDLADAKAEFALVRWRVVLPVLIGMFAALLLMAGLMEGLVSAYPVHTKGLFFGLVLASLWVPFSMAARAPVRRPGARPWGPGALAAAVLAAVASYTVVSLPPADVDSNPVIIVVAAALAISALVVPGLSGSFILLTFGLYETTLAAVNDRDLGYVGLFVLGALVGLASIVKLLQWLLEHWQRITLVILTGAMAGSLRALWPWQTEDRSLLPPADGAWQVALLAVAGFAVVVVALVIERRVSAAHAATQPDDAPKSPVNA